MDPLTFGFIAGAVAVAAVGIISLLRDDRSGALDDDKAGLEPRRAKRGASFGDQHRDHD
ncbi:MAG: hypothetical protein AVDCRST_MAG88-3711 [uncultured Thermomicrobiales bacterium]|uniref:Uncharacterized protein n=1 Tax=uncultured Thermomicrobiales bacterium TaxID=1645740 RepID=A0A6J4VVL2_9BACT|nr:MAG: hypothetical protein AVDCRST_MAG88-3711 [uncultured Thermomicrobiales bacterium]